MFPPVSDSPAFNLLVIEIEKFKEKKEILTIKFILRNYVGDLRHESWLRMGMLQYYRRLTSNVGSLVWSTA